MAKEKTVSPALAAISVDEAILVEQARAGDMSAFSRLVVHYQDRVFNTCWRLSGNIEDARDLTQEAFLHALARLDSFRQQASFYTWLFRIAVNLSISHRRKTARTVQLSLHAGDDQWPGDRVPAWNHGCPSCDGQDPPARLSAREVHHRVAEELDRLDDDHRAVLVLRDIESFDYQQIAEILEVPVGTVKSRLHRARMDMRARLERVLTPH